MEEEQEFKDFLQFFKQATSFSPYPYQQSFSTSEQLPQIVKIPTGLGKTAMAILGWVWRRRFHEDGKVRNATPRRLIYCLPMRVLVEQTRNNIIEWLSNLGIDNNYPDGIGVHILMGGEKPEDWSIYPEQDAILIGTQDMLLSRALNRGYAASRSRWPCEFGLLHNDSLWIFDEIQLMGSGLTTGLQLDAFRNNHFGYYGSVSSVWMSATLETGWLCTPDFTPPPENESSFLSLTEGDLKDKRLEKLISANKKLSRAAVDPQKTSDLAGVVLENHIEALRSSKKSAITAVIVNKVSRAQDIYRELSKLCDQSNRKRKTDAPSVKKAEIPAILLLHSRFRPRDRAHQVGKLIRADTIIRSSNIGGKGGKDEFDKLVLSNGLIVVSTQVVEAGIDFSARTLFTDTAPWPSLIQRFGRCNRRAEYSDACVFWFDPGDSLTFESTAPYEPGDLENSRSILLAYSDKSVNSGNIPSCKGEVYQRHILRKKDLLELFDTTADLAGHDIDISRFIRDSEDNNVFLAWRNIADGAGQNEQSKPGTDELCPVPVNEFKKYISRIKKSRLGNRYPIWEWDFVEGEWITASEWRAMPGKIYLIGASLGGYDAPTGWNPQSNAEVPQVQVPLPVAEEDSSDNDPLSESLLWQSIASHTDDVYTELKNIIKSLEGNNKITLPENSLTIAARWHDRGKAHPSFQAKLAPGSIETEEAKTILDGHIPAKAPGNCWRKDKIKKYASSDDARRKHFRHELASALSLLQQRNIQQDFDVIFLAAYLIAAHHGKVRCSIRSMPGEHNPGDSRRFARGIWDGDMLPRTELGGGIISVEHSLDLEMMELGSLDEDMPSWVEAVFRLIESPELGPFRLAYLEALLRAADRRASAKARKR